MNKVSVPVDKIDSLTVFDSVLGRLVTWSLSESLHLCSNKRGISSHFALRFQGNCVNAKTDVKPDRLFQEAPQAVPNTGNGEWPRGQLLMLLFVNHPACAIAQKKYCGFSSFSQFHLKGCGWCVGTIWRHAKFLKERKIWSRHVRRRGHDLISTLTCRCRSQSTGEAETQRAHHYEEPAHPWQGHPQPQQSHTRIRVSPSKQTNTKK